MAIFGFTPDGFRQRLLALFPMPWAGDYARASGGSISDLALTLGLPLKSVKDGIDYVALQTRIASATDSNLEAIAKDFLGANAGRYSLLTGLNLVPETDAQFSARIRATIIAPQNTLAAIQAAVQQYITTLYIAQSVSNVLLLGLDAAGGLDSRGALDGQAKSVPAVPAVSCFDLQSDPKRSAQLGITPSQFVILFTYGGITRDGFFLNRSHLRFGHLLNSKIQVVPAINSTLAALVGATRAVGTVPIYADNRAP